MASDKEYAVNWKSHMSHMKEAFESLFDNNEFVDVTLYCEGQKIGAHKMVLSACSPYFRSIFKDVPCQHHVIVLNNVDFSIMQNIINFIYHGEVSVHNSKLNLFLQTAQMLKISGLMEAKSFEELHEEDSKSVEPTEPVTKRKRDNNDLPAEVQQVLKLPRPDAAPPEPEEVGLMDVKCEPNQLDTVDPLEDPLLQYDSSSHDYLQETPYLTEEEELEKDVLEEVQKVVASGLLPEKSKEKYQKQLVHFESWKKSRNVRGINEDTLLAYFRSLSSTCVGSSLWCKYSMLKSTLKIQEQVDISQFGKLQEFLKTKSSIHKPKKTNVLQKKHIDKFLVEASDHEYLMMKIVLIMGIFGACRCEELVKMTVDDITENGTYLSVDIPMTKTDKPRRFIIVKEGCAVDPIDLFKKYMVLRPNNISHNRLFLHYVNGKCTVQPVGINKLSSIPSAIASFLNLEHPETYTGHSLRRSSDTLLAEGACVIDLKRHGGRKSSRAAVMYVEDSNASQLRTASSSSSTSIDFRAEEIIGSIPVDKQLSTFKFQSD